MQLWIRWSRACCLGGIVLLGASSGLGAPPPPSKQAPQYPSPELVPTSDFQDRSGDLEKLYEPTFAPKPKRLREHIVRNDQPVEHWHNAHPVGNGRLGAMTFAKFPQDEIYLFEETLWAGPPFPQNGPGTKEALDGVRVLLEQDKFAEATQYAVQHLLPPRIWPRSYQMLGKLELTYFSELLHHPHVSKRDHYLNLNQAVASWSMRVFKLGALQQEVFASAPDDVIVVRLTTGKPDGLFVNVCLSRAMDATVEVLADGDISMHGQVDKAANRPGVKYQALARVLPEGGTVEVREHGLRVSGAKAVTILIAAETDYNHISPLNPRLNDRLAECREVLDNAEEKSYQELRERSVKDHQSYFNRATLDLGATDPKRLALTTAQRLDDFAEGPPSKFSARRKYELSDVQDPDLIEDLFQMGRYLLICSSRPGTLPPGLGGIWMGDYSHTWNNDFHTDINFQQNYWPVELTNLSQLHEPFITLTDDIRKDQGKRLAGLLGCRGFALTHVTDAWKFAALYGDKPQWALWPMGGVWNCSHVMEHYNFTQDDKFLAEVAYPLLRDNALFLVDWLIFDEERGEYVTSPSVSPENHFTFKDQAAQVAVGSAMDQMLCYESFVNFLHASKLLGIEDELTAKVEEVLDKLSRPKIGADGRILEWGREDLVESDPRHRHLSHLYDCYPGCEITPGGTPELAEAVMESLAARTTNHVRPHGMGFVRGHLLNLYARLEQADHAHRIVLLMMKDNTMDSLFHNLGSNHILLDGQGAWTAGVGEMLLQSHGPEHVVRLLPALPAAWKDGSFSGLCARGGFDIDLDWKQSRPTRVSVLSKAGEVFRIKGTGVKVVTCAGERVEIKLDAGGLVSFETDRGKTYEIRFEEDAQ